MTGLFDRLTLVKKPEKVEESIPLHVPSSIVLEEGKMSQGEPQSRDTKEDSGVIPFSDAKIEVAPSQVPAVLGDIPDLGDGVSFGGETSPTDAILELAGDDSVFAVKGVTPFPPAFMAAQVQADYHEELFGKNNVVSVMLRAVCVWSSRYNSSKRGERAKLTFNALGSAKEEQFLIEKETKGLLKR